MGASRRPSGRIRVVTPNEMPEESPQNDRPEGHEETQYLIDPIHNEPDSIVRERVAKYDGQRDATVTSPLLNVHAQQTQRFRNF